MLAAPGIICFYVNTNRVLTQVRKEPTMLHWVYSHLVQRVLTVQYNFFLYMKIVFAKKPFIKDIREIKVDGTKYTE